MTSKTYGPLEVNETNEYDIESLQETKETKEEEPIVRGKFKVIDQLDQDHLKKQKIKKIHKYLSLLLFTTTVLGAAGFMLYYDKLQTQDKFQDYQKPDLYNSDEDNMKDMSARVMGHYHRRRKCSDYVYGCCEIYYGPKEKDFIEISSYRMVKQDVSGSNCPFLKDLVEEFNINYIQDYGDVGTEGYCQIDTSYDSTMKNISGGKMNLVQPKDDSYGYNCNRVGDLVHMYENHWPENETLMDIVFLSIIIGLVCCALSRK